MSARRRTPFDLDRRAFLKVGTTAAGGLLLSLSLPGCRARGPGRAAAAPFAPNPFLRIDPDGGVTLWAKNPDMGEGVKTSLPMIVAEELCADWSRVRVEQAELDRKYGGQGSGGSDGIASDWDNLRRAGAAAREMLITAAAQGWGVARDECAAREGFVLHAASGRRAAFGDLAGSASRLPVPKDPPLKKPSGYTIVGSRVPGVDNKAIVTGHPLYGLDVRVPGMARAVIEKAPTYGGRPAKVDSGGTLAVPGVLQVVTIEGLPNPTHLRPGVAVVASSTWAAIKGREVLAVEWSNGPDPKEGSEDLARRFADLAKKPGKRLRESGDADAAFRNASRVFESVYEFPFLSHATLEPMNCVADVRNGRCDIWGPMQMPGSARSVVAAATGLPKEAVRIHPTRLGGGFGRRLLSDYVAEAAVVSQKIGRPVQVVWTREDDMRNDYYRPAGYQRLRAAVDGRGAVTGWHHHLVNVSRNAYRLDQRPPESTEVYGMFAPRVADATQDLAMLLQPAAIPNCVVEYSAVSTSIPTGAWRAPAHNVNAFAIQSFLDEIAHETRQDPAEFRLTVLGNAGDYPARPNEDMPVPYNPDRLKGVVRLAAEKAGWGSRPPEGVARGIAGHFTFGSYAAHVVELSVEKGKRVRIRRVVSAVDCGIPVNVSGVEAQTEGGVVDALGSSFFGEMPVENSRARHGSFDGYRLLRHDEAPPVEVHIVPSHEHPTGFGEIALPPFAPALANAIFAATGERVRRLPFVRSGFTLAALGRA
jgi:isoquinoline 1-oxidoreductase subunit beta